MFQAHKVECGKYSSNFKQAAMEKIAAFLPLEIRFWALSKIDAPDCVRQMLFIAGLGAKSLMWTGPLLSTAADPPLSRGVACPSLNDWPQIVCICCKRRRMSPSHFVFHRCSVFHVGDFVPKVSSNTLVPEQKERVFTNATVTRRVAQVFHFSFKKALSVEEVFFFTYWKLKNALHRLIDIHNKSNLQLHWDRYPMKDT